MQLRNEIPDTFWSLFRSVNRDIILKHWLCINEEYQYNNYFLTREVCIQVLGDMNARKRFKLQWEENETEFDMLETPSSRILNWLLKTGWLKRIEDYQTLVTNIVIPDYSAVLLRHLSGCLQKICRTRKSISRMCMRHYFLLRTIAGRTSECCGRRLSTRSG